MESLGWTKASYIAALAAGAITCLVVGMLAGVLVGGGHPHNVLQVITDPAPAASAHDLTPASHERPAAPAALTTTVSRTITVTAAATTVTAPAQTVTETATETVTESAPTTAEQTTTP